MSTSARDRATARQREAADPAVSSFVEASAGSGKTKLLKTSLRTRYRDHYLKP